MINALDLLNEVSDRLGWPQIKTLEAQTLRSEHRKLLRLLNRMLRTLGGYNDWPLLQEEATIRLVAAESGDADSSEFVTATQDSTAVTIDNATLDQTYVGRAIQVSGYNTIYRIASVTSATTLTLDQAWIDADIDATDECTYTIAMDRYALPSDYDRPLGDALNFDGILDIDPLTPQDFRQWRYDHPGVIDNLGEPQRYTILGLTDNQAAQIIVFDPYPENARLLKFPYMRIHPKIDSDQDKVLYPISYLGALADTLEYVASRSYDDASPVKLQQLVADAIRAHNIQQSSAGPTDSNIQIRPANRVRRQIRAAYGRPTTRVDWGDRWDTGEAFGR